MVVPELDWVADFEGRVLVSLALLGVLAALAWVARYARLRVDSEQSTRVVNAILAVGLLAGTVAVGWSLVSIWSLSLTQLFDQPVILATRLVVTLVVLIGVYLGTGVLRRVIDEFAHQRTSVSQHQTELVFLMTRVGIYLLALLLVLAIWDVNLGGVLVGAGFLGIVVGLAARQTLGSLIAGFVLMFARPFEIGDWVAIGDHEGIVTEISIVNTRIQTFDGEYAMLPNDLVGSSEIINRTRKGRLRIHVGVGVDYDADLDRAQETATQAIKSVDGVLSVPKPEVVVRGFGASTIDLDCRFWIDKPSARRRWRAQTAVVKAIKEAFDEAGIKIPFPQRELMGREETGGFRLGEESAVGLESPAEADGASGDG